MTLTELADLFACAALLMGLLFIALGVLGMLLCLPINEKPLRPAPAPAAAR